MRLALLTFWVLSCGLVLGVFATVLSWLFASWTGYSIAGLASFVVLPAGAVSGSVLAILALILRTNPREVTLQSDELPSEKPTNLQA